MIKPPDWFLRSMEPSEPLNNEVIVARLGLALSMGIVVAGLYYFALGRQKRDGATMPLTLVLMSLLVCMVMLIVGNDIARAFTLGGTLAIIRFRTVVDDTRDTAFVIAAVVVGMGMGTAHGEVILIGLPIFAAVIILSTLLLSSWYGTREYRVTLRLPPDGDPDAITKTVFANLPSRPILMAFETAKQGTAADASYSIRLKNHAALLTLIAALRHLEGVQSVEAKTL